MRFEPKQLVDVEVGPADPSVPAWAWRACAPPGDRPEYRPARTMPPGRRSNTVRTEIVADDGEAHVVVRWGTHSGDIYAVRVAREYVRPAPAFAPPVEETEVSVTATVVSDTGGPTLTVRIGDAIVVVSRDRVYA